MGAQKSSGRSLRLNWGCRSCSSTVCDTAGCWGSGSHAGLNLDLTVTDLVDLTLDSSHHGGTAESSESE